VWTSGFDYLIDKIEQVQHHFTKRLAGLNKMPYSEKLRVLGLPSLECRRLNYDVILAYKILHDMIVINLPNSFKFQQSNTRVHSFKLAKRYCSRDISKHFFSNLIIDMWNSLPSDVVSAKSVFSFKRKLSEMDL